MFEFHKKWGEVALGGFQQLPDLLLKSQAKLKLTSNDMLVLMHVTMHWWYADQLPFPATSVIAKRMGMTSRTVQRSLNNLVERGLIAKAVVVTEQGERRGWDPSGLVTRLHQLADGDPVVRLKAARILKVAAHAG